MSGGPYLIINRTSTKALSQAPSEAEPAEGGGGKVVGLPCADLCCEGQSTELKGKTALSGRDCPGFRQLA